MTTGTSPANAESVPSLDVVVLGIGVGGVTAALEVPGLWRWVETRPTLAICCRAES